MDKYIIGLFQELEQEVIADIARRVKKTERYTETAELMAKSMYELGYAPAAIRSAVMRHLQADKDYIHAVAENTNAYKADVLKLIQEMVEEAALMGDKLVAEAGAMSYNGDMRYWNQAGQELSEPNTLTQIMDAARRQTNGELRNLTRTTGFRNTPFAFTPIENMYQKEMDLAMLKVATGTFSYDQAVNDCIKRLAQSGLRSIDYASGRSYQLDTAARMVVRTSVSQMAGKITEANCESTEVDHVITSQHIGARPDHAVWQNKVFTYIGKASSEYPDFRASTGYGTAGGLKGVNCRHDFYPFWVGISIHPADLEEPEPVNVNGKEYNYYQATQKQRAMERNIRATKREIEAQKALGVETPEQKENMQQLRAKLRQQTAEYNQFSRDVNIRPKQNRLSVVSGSSNLNGYHSISSGALSHKNDPLGTRREAHAERYYQEIRNRKSEYIVPRLAHNAGISEEKASSVYNHIFVNEHLFENGDIKRFDPDYNMAESFRRLLDGDKIQPHDLILAEHEYLEYCLMKEYNMTYEAAHKIAEESYNYSAALREFLGGEE